jgi:hypothetical protein
MPLRHSPQRTPTGETTTALILQTYDSDTPSERSGSSNVNIRSKKRREPDEEVKDLKTEMRSLFTKLSSSVEQQFNAIRIQNEELQKSLQFMSDKYDSVLERMQRMEEKKVEDGKKMQVLEEKVEFLERKARASGLEIRNVPKNSNNEKEMETKEDMCKIVQSVGRLLKMDIKEEHIKDAYRVNSNKETTKPLLIEFASVIIKEKILRGVKHFNKGKPPGEKLNTGLLDITGPKKPVFIAETLTQKTQKLFYKSRKFSKENHYSYCWISRGSVYLRKADGQPFTRITSEADLNKLRKK